MLRTREERARLEREAYLLHRAGRDRYAIQDELGLTDAEFDRAMLRQAKPSKRNERFDDHHREVVIARLEYSCSELMAAWHRSCQPQVVRETGRATLDRNGDIVNLPELVRITGQAGNPAFLAEYRNTQMAIAKLRGLEKDRAEIDLNVNDPSAAAERMDSVLDRFAAAARERGLVGTPQGELPESTGEAGAPLQLAVLGTPEPVRA